MTSFSKIFEKVIYNRLYEHVTHHKLLTKGQYECRSNYSTENSIFHLTNNILKALENRRLVFAIFCDLSKAFDYVNNDILLAKLKFYGVRGHTFNLFASYLNSRYQRVTTRTIGFNIYYSECHEVKRGVPQGSILGPLLFILYVNDLPGSISHICTPTLFADDTNIICTQVNRNNFKDEIEIILQEITKWFNTNLLHLN